MDTGGEDLQIDDHGTAYKLTYIAAVMLQRPLLILGGVISGINAFVHFRWILCTWMSLAAAGIFFYGLAKVMDHEELRGLPGGRSMLASGLIAMLVAVAMIVGVVAVAVTGMTDPSR